MMETRLNFTESAVQNITSVLESLQYQGNLNKTNNAYKLECVINADGHNHNDVFDKY